MTQITTAEAILIGCREEGRIRAGLSRSEAGQVADTYDTLHSVRLIGLILDTVPPALSEEERTQYLFFLLARLFDANMAELCDAARHAVQAGQLSCATDKLSWIERLLRLKHDMSLFSANIPADPGAAPRSIPAFHAQLEEFGTALLAHFDEAGFSAIALSGGSGHPGAMLFHRAKNVLLLAKEDALGDHPPIGVPAEIVAAHLECVTAAAAGLKMERTTHINQFCLLHQVPELIVPTVLRSWEAIEVDLDSGDIDAALEHARLAGDLLSIMVLSIAPLAELLTPADYFRFRGNLGATSGSSSAVLRGKLLTTAYVRLAERAAREARLPSSAEPLRRRLSALIARNRSLLYKWRALHMALPRNVLGSEGTKSLMGSPDALKTVRSMTEAFAGKDPLTAIHGHVPAYDFPPERATARLDAALLAETGRVARDAFSDVQKRVGIWAKSRKA